MGERLSDVRITGVESAVMRLHRAGLVGLCLAAFVTPVAQVAVRHEYQGHLAGPRHLGSTLRFVSDTGVQRLIDEAAVDGTLDVRVNAVRIGLLLVAGGLIAALLSLLAVDEFDDSPLERGLRWGAVAALSVGAVICAVTLGMFPNDGLLIGPSWGLLLPLFAAGWLGVGRRVAHDFW